MNPSAAASLDGLREFATAYRADKPLAVSAGPEADAQRAILAAHLATWIDGEAARLPSSHAIAITTSDLGIPVVNDVFASDEPLSASLRSRVVAVREIEYRLWTKDNPDPEHALHVNHWSWIKAPVPRQRWHEFNAFPLREGEAYWLHRTGTSGPGATAVRHAHLWKWTGSHAALLRPFIQERISAL